MIDSAHVTGFAIGIMIAFLTVLAGDWMVRVWIKAYKMKGNKKK